jgi:hypothetical protein
VTLSARAMAPMLAGESDSSVGRAVRGNLGTEVSPRNVLVNLANSGSGQWK